MITFPKSIFKGKDEPKNDFSDFFHNASSREKKKLILDVVRQANEDQREILRQYDKMPKTSQ